MKKIFFAIIGFSSLVFADDRYNLDTYQTIEEKVDELKKISRHIEVNLSYLTELQKMLSNDIKEIKKVTDVYKNNPDLTFEIMPIQD